MQRLLNVQFVRFLLVGVLNTGFSYAVYALLLFAGLSYAPANFGAALLGIVFSFRTQGSFVFRNRDPRLIVRFAIFWLVIFLFNIGLIAGFVHLGFNAYAAGALALVPVVLASFVVQKFLVFVAPRATSMTSTSKPSNL